MANIMRLGGGSGGGKSKKLLSSLSEGSLVSVLEDGKLTPFYVAKHNYEPDLNGEGRTLLVRKDIHSTGVWNSSNKNILDGSTIDTWLNADYANMLSATVKANIPATTIEYTPGVNVSTAVTTTVKNVFLLSVAELGLSTTYANNEGELLPIANLLKVATLNGTATVQWTRSPLWSSPAIVCIVNATGAIGSESANSSYGVRPCFTLPADMALRDEPFADGAWGLADEDVLIDTETATPAAKAGVAYTNGIADLTPAQLHEIAAAISANPRIDKDMGTIYYDKGDVHRKISTGDTQNILFGGVSYTVNIVGFNHDNLTSGTVYGSPTATCKAGMTFHMVDCHTTDPMNGSNTNAGGWTSSWMRTNLIPIYFSNLAAELQNAIKSVTKLTSAGSNSSAISATEDKSFLLSEIEIFGSLTHSFSGEGSQYAYYKAGNSKVKKINGSATGWWERSPAKDTISFCNVTNAGGASGVNSGSSAPIGIAFAYCI